MKIEHVRFDPASGLHFIVLAGSGYEYVDTTTELRCGAYRFQVEQHVQHYPEASPPCSSWLVSGRNPPLEQMVVHESDEPLTDEEIAQAVQHLLMVPRLLVGIDCEGLAALLSKAIACLPSGEDKQCAVLLHLMARSLAGTTAVLPVLASVLEVERYKAGILNALSAARLATIRDANLEAGLPPDHAD